MRSSRRPTLIIVAGLATASLAVLPSLAPAPTSATPSASAAATGKADSVRSGLGNGLGRLLAASQATSFAGTRSPVRPAGTMIRDSAGRVLVDLAPQAGVDRADFRRQAEAKGLSVVSVEQRHGILEGYVTLDDVTGLAALPGTGTLSAAAAPIDSTGSVDDQGVPFQKVDQAIASGIDGRGITVGALSDSYDTSSDTDIRAADDVASGDLPGRGNSVNPHKVKVLEDSDSGEDEGRAMLQIIHDVAPRANLCFATANSGEVGFANNIRALADKSGRCGADVVVDDVGYFDEPFFSDGILSDAVDDVAAQGTQYFSSAGNGGRHQAWRLPINLIPAADAAKGTNLDFSQVPTDLYDGGVQDMNPSGGVDPAMDYALTPAGGIYNLQWDDPIDYDGAQVGDPIFTASGELTATNQPQTFAFTPTADQVGDDVLVTVDGVPSGSTDVVVTVVKPDGTEVGPVDTGTSPEVVPVTLDEPGAYTIVVEGFEGATGPFTVKVQPIVAPSKVTDDFNALFFTTSGQFVGAVADDNALTGRPQELTSLAGIAHLQIVVGRSGTGPLQATTLAEDSGNTGVYIDEYYDPTAPSIHGHPTAQGANAVAAYDAFRPFLPEAFTSQGGKLQVKFDSDGNPLPADQQVRQVPAFAGVDGMNTTFFISDTARDPDTIPNFFGTSAAAPSAAAISALVLDAKGGPGSVSPSKMTALLKRSTFAHDLDPFISRGTAGKLTITARGDQGSEAAPFVGYDASKKFFSVTYDGSRPITSMTLDGATGSPTSLGGGIVFDTRAYDGPTSRTEGFPFVVGGATGIDPASISATFGGSGAPQTVAGQFRRMTLNFADGLKKGDTFVFGIDRDLAKSGLGFATEGDSADELGGAVEIPSGRIIDRGVGIRTVDVTGNAVQGYFKNKLGTGFSIVDGYGLIDAAEAVGLL